MANRLLTSFIGIAIFFAVVLSPAVFLYIAIALLIIGMLFEMYRVMCVGRFLRYVGYASALMVWLGFLMGKFVAIIVAITFIFMLAMILMHGKVTSKKVMAVGFVTLAISALMSMLILTRRHCDKYTVILPFVCAWLTDTGAFMIGNLMGKHKLAEKISPKKTIEGGVGGVVFSTLGGAAYIIIMTLIMTSKMPANAVILKFAVLGFFASIVSQLGDLAASCIKRDFEKKDYGKILPGHGGLLDRFDSVLFAVPFVYYVMMHFIL
ncbi:MAG: phosphatidate cytidylyltransferase [Clostridia bacterium]|nr:phosphatidate cytidylyltransferase [Clostridia bacterium]